MASIRKEVEIDASPEDVWAAMRDVGALHTKLAPSFVTDCKLDGDTRIVTFGNGLVAREIIVDVDVDVEARRIAWSTKSERPSHHNASSQVLRAAMAPRWSGSLISCPTK